MSFRASTTRSPVAVYSQAVHRVKDAEQAIWEAHRALENADESLKDRLKAAITLLKEISVLLTNAQRDHLKTLGLPENYVMSKRVPIKALTAKMLPPVTILTLAVLIPFPFIFKAYGIGLTVYLIIVPLVLLALHEGLHALMFLLVGRHRPGFQLECGMLPGFIGAFCVGNCLLSRRENLLVSLAPLLGITLLGGVLWLLLPAWSPGFYLLISANAVSSLGDLWVAALLLRSHPQALCLDTRYEVIIFEPSPSDHPR